jgi:hypothetical protein
MRTLHLLSRFAKSGQPNYVPCLGHQQFIAISCLHLSEAAIVWLPRVVNLSSPVMTALILINVGAKLGQASIELGPAAYRRQGLAYKRCENVRSKRLYDFRLMTPSIKQLRSEFLHFSS